MYSITSMNQRHSQRKIALTRHELIRQRCFEKRVALLEGEVATRRHQAKKRRHKVTRQVGGYLAKFVVIYFRRILLLGAGQR